MGITKTYMFDLQDAADHAQSEFRRRHGRPGEVDDPEELAELVKYAREGMLANGWANKEGGLSPDVLADLKAEVSDWIDPHEIIC